MNKINIIRDIGMGYFLALVVGVGCATVAIFGNSARMMDITIAIFGTLLLISLDSWTDRI